MNNDDFFPGNWYRCKQHGTKSPFHAVCSHNKKDSLCFAEGKDYSFLAFFLIRFPLDVIAPAGQTSRHR